MPATRVKSRRRPQEDQEPDGKLLQKVIGAVRGHLSLTLMIVLTLAGAALRIHYFSGLQGTDDLRHAWGGYFFWQNLHRPFIQYHGFITSVRIGMDFLLWIAYSIFGPHEWSAAAMPFLFSLLGIWAMYFLGRRVAGEPAGLTAAGVQTFLPVDVYQSGLWLQDVMLSTCIAASVIWLIRSFEGPSRRAVIAWGMMSGALLGFAFYLKEITPMVLGVFVLWGAVVLIRDRRGLRVGWAVVGFLAFMAFVALYWYHVTGDPLFNLRRIVAIQEVIGEKPVPFGEMVLSFPRTLEHNWSFGLTLLLTPVFLVSFAVARGLRYRGLLLLLFVALGYSLIKVAQMGVQQRYLLLIGPPTVIIAAGALSVFTRRLPRAAGQALLIGAVLLTAVGLVRCRPQWGREILEPVRAINTILALADTPEDPVFADPRTLMILYQLNGFQPYRGGLYRYPTELPTEKAVAAWHTPAAPAFSSQYGVAPDGEELAQRTHGWVVYYEPNAEKFNGKWHVPMPDVLYNAPANWVKVVTYQTPRTGEVSLYLVRPPTTPASTD